MLYLYLRDSNFWLRYIRIVQLLQRFLEEGKQLRSTKIHSQLSLGHTLQIQSNSIGSVKLYFIIYQFSSDNFSFQLFGCKAASVE